MGKAEAVVYRDKAREYRWRVVSANGRIIAASSEGYATQAAALANLKTVTGVTPPPSGTQSGMSETPAEDQPTPTDPDEDTPAPEPTPDTSTTTTIGPGGGEPPETAADEGDEGEQPPQ